MLGHGPLASKTDVAEFRAMLVTARDRIEKLFNEGKTEEEVIALKPLADLDATWARNPQARDRQHAQCLQLVQAVLIARLGRQSRRPSCDMTATAAACCPP